MTKNNLKPLDLSNINLTKYLFFTWKWWVWKTSISCAIAVNLADWGKKVLLISTDPASNLQDVFNTELNSKWVKIKEVPNLEVANLNPEEAAKEYRESVISLYKWKLPDSVISNMEEQLSGSCTVEIAAFDQFSNFITDKKTSDKHDFIVFDTAPTGHTLRMLQLPSAWNNFISESTNWASCLGQLSWLEAKKNIYKNAVANLADKNKTTLFLITRPEETSFLEVKRSSEELSELWIKNQVLIINWILQDASDKISKQITQKQQNAIENIPKSLALLETYTLPLRSYNILGIDKIRTFFKSDDIENILIINEKADFKKLDFLIDDIYKTWKKVIFTMWKWWVWKTTIAASIALWLAKKWVKVHLTSTDPANHLEYVFEKNENITLSKIDEKEELKKYQNEVLSKARETMSEDDISYIQEDLKSPCTQEIAIFKAFAEIVEKAENEVVVIDTAPTGHTLLLLDSTQSYHREVERTKWDTPISIQKLLPRLRDKNQTEVVIVTLPEATPIFEAQRLKEDLKRAWISNKYWVANQCLSMDKTSNPILIARSQAEIKWLKKIEEITDNNFVSIPWLEDASIKNIL